MKGQIQIKLVIPEGGGHRLPVFSTTLRDFLWEIFSLKGSQVYRLVYLFANGELMALLI